MIPSREFNIFVTNLGENLGCKGGSGTLVEAEGLVHEPCYWFDSGDEQTNRLPHQTNSRNYEFAMHYFLRSKPFAPSSSCLVNQHNTPEFVPLQTQIKIAPTEFYVQGRPSAVAARNVAKQVPLLLLQTNMPPNYLFWFYTRILLFETARTSSCCPVDLAAKSGSATLPVEMSPRKERLQPLAHCWLARACWCLNP